jgi:hypothetical protein
MFLAVWLLSVSYLGANLNHGWLSYDDGALGQSAERVLHGEIPHLDFADPYTGGLAFLDALVFKIFGVQLIWLRLPLFVFFVLWVPAVYVIARQFLSPLASAGVTLVSVARSVPNYPAAMPSWYNLYFATFGVLAVAKYIRKPALHWLVLAGLAGGCSFLFQSVGLYSLPPSCLSVSDADSIREGARPRQTNPGRPRCSGSLLSGRSQEPYVFAF